MEFEKTTWRLIQTTAARGAWNMAVDEAILEAVGRYEVLPTLRLYAWSPACLSLGYAQPFSDINIEVLESLGWDLVRRPTGGRAILHADELTYSVIGPPEEARLAKDILFSYFILSQAILAALHLLDIPAQAEEMKKNATNSANNPKKINQNPVCFEVPSNYEITVHGKKIVGSAQARRRAGVLQHGTFPLTGDLTRIIRVLNFEDDIKRHEAQERLLEHATSAEQILGSAIDLDLAAKAFISAFQNELNLELTPSKLSQGELARIESLMAEKYANPSWTKRI
jgi:lipoyl(octanoyl) transferase